MFSKCDRREETGFCRDISSGLPRNAGKWHACLKYSQSRSHQALRHLEELPWLGALQAQWQRRGTAQVCGGGWAAVAPITPRQTSHSQATCGFQSLPRVKIDFSVAQYNVVIDSLVLQSLLFLWMVWLFAATREEREIGGSPRQVNWS